MAEATALERARLTIRGVRAELVLEDGRITLSKDGPPATSLSFTVDRVRGTVLEPGSRGGRGWIHLAVVGGTLVPPGELAAMSDPYTIPLTSRSAVTARRLARFVEKHLHERGLPPEPTFAASALERGRFSSGVALAQAPESVGAEVDLPVANGSRRSGATERNRDDDSTDVQTAAAEAAIERRAEAAIDAAGSWVKPTGPTGQGGAASSGGPVHPGSSAAPTEPPPSEPPAPGPPAPGPPASEPPASSTAAGRELVGELRQLGELHASGVLTDAEFEQAKARVLG